MSVPRRRIVLGAIGLVALVFGPFATYQLTRTAERSPALLLADVAVGWSMIAAGLIIADRRPGNRIGPLAILTGFAWFVGDFTSSDIAVVSYLATVVHGWFDPLFALVILAYPTGRLIRRVDRALAIGFIAVQAGWTLVQAYALRPIAWWDCPTCISTVDRWIGRVRRAGPARADRNAPAHRSQHRAARRRRRALDLRERRGQAPPDPGAARRPGPRRWLHREVRLADRPADEWTRAAR